MRDFRVRQGGTRTDKGQVKTNGKPGVFLCLPDGVVEGTARDHQASARENPVFVGFYYCPVDARRESEIVAIYDHKSRPAARRTRGPDFVFRSEFNHLLLGRTF